MSIYKLVIFDFDGTLADSLGWFVKAVNTAADKYNFKKIDEEKLDELRNYSARKMMSHLNVPTWKMPFIARYMRQSMRDNLHKIKLFDGVGELFERLNSSDVKIAIVSTSSADSIKAILGEQNASMVDYYECRASVFGKPAKINKVLKRSKLTKGDAILVGDEIRDVHAARNVAIDVGVVSWGYTNIDSLNSVNPDERFYNMDDIASKTC